jgi:hypothetical protein
MTKRSDGKVCGDYLHELFRKDSSVREII